MSEPIAELETLLEYFCVPVEAGPHHPDWAVGPVKVRGQHNSWTFTDLTEEQAKKLEVLLNAMPGVLSRLRQLEAEREVWLGVGVKADNERRRLQELLTEWINAVAVWGFGRVSQEPTPARAKEAVLKAIEDEKRLAELETERDERTRRLEERVATLINERDVAVCHLPFELRERFNGRAEPPLALTADSSAALERVADVLRQVGAGAGGPGWSVRGRGHPAGQPPGPAERDRGARPAGDGGLVRLLRDRP